MVGLLFSDIEFTFSMDTIGVH